MPHRRRICKITSAWTMIGVAGLLAGCGDDPATAPAPTPTYSCTPDPTGAPCTAELAAAQADEAKAYEEAIFVYQEFTKERNRLVIAGGSPTPTATMEKYAAGQYLAVVSSDLALMSKNEFFGTSGLEVGSIERVNVSEDTVVLRVCEDGSAINLIDRNGQKLGNGTRGTVEITIRSEDEGWRIVDGEDSGVEVCLK